MNGIYLYFVNIVLVGSYWDLIKRKKNRKVTTGLKACADKNRNTTEKKVQNVF